MSLLDEARKYFRNARESTLSRRRVEDLKDGREETKACTSCNEILPKYHYLEAQNLSTGFWEPFCKECFDVTMAIRRSNSHRQ